MPAGIAEFDGVDVAGAFPDVLHGEAREPVAEGAYGGAAGDDDEFGEAGLPFAFLAQFEQVAARVDGEVGDGGDVEEPLFAVAPRQDEVVAVAQADGCEGVDDAVDFVVRGGVAHGGLGAVDVDARQEAAGAAPLDVALREGGGVGEVAVVEDVVAVEDDVVLRHVAAFGGHAEGVVFEGHGEGAFEGVDAVDFHLEAHATAVDVEAGLDVLFLEVEEHFGLGGEGEADAAVARREAEAPFGRGGHVAGEVGALNGGVAPDVEPRQFGPQLEGPAPFGPEDVSGVVGDAVIMKVQKAVGLLDQGLCLCRQGAEAMRIRKSVRFISPPRPRRTPPWLRGLWRRPRSSPPRG